MRKTDNPQGDSSKGIKKDGRLCSEISCLYSTHDMTEVGMVSILVAKRVKRHTLGSRLRSPFEAYIFNRVFMYGLDLTALL